MPTTLMLHVLAHVLAATIWVANTFFADALLRPAFGEAVVPQHSEILPAALPKSRAPLPTFVLNQYQGAPVDFADYRGRVVLVNFWATWCAPCVAEFPSLLALKSSFAAQPFEILAINMGEPDDAIAGFIGSLGREVNFPILLDRPASPMAKRWPVRALPTTIIVDKAGRLALKVRGERAWNSAEARASLRPLLHE